jgi:hypothetical protein
VVIIYNGVAMIRKVCAIVITLIGIIGCSKTSNNNLIVNTCDSPAFVNTLLNNSSMFPHGYYAPSLSNIYVINETNDWLKCQATLTLISRLSTQNTLSIPTSYIIYKSNSNFKPLVLDLTSTQENNITTWINTLNNITNNIGDYRFTPYGALYVMNESNAQQQLYFNGMIVNPEISNTQVKIENTYTLGNKYIFLIGSYSGGSIDNDTRNNLLIQIVPNSQYSITTKFAYSNIAIESNHTLLITGKSLGRPYAESNDYPIYLYNESLIILQDIKSESYYLDKFATITTKDIINQAIAEQCFNQEKQLLDIDSNDCKYGIKYCFEFRAISNTAKHDKNYSILNKSCNK